MSGVDENPENEQAIDALVIVHNHLYLMEQSIRREIKQRTGHEPECFSWSSFERETDQQMEHEIEPEEGVALSAFQREVCYDFWRQRCILRLVCRRILYYAQRAVKAGYMDDETRADIAARAVIRLGKIKDRGETEGMAEQRPVKIIHTTFDDFHEIMKGIGARRLDDELHKKKVEALMVYDPKRDVRVPSRFCSFHLAGFDLDDKSTAPLGPPYQPGPLPPGTSKTKYVDTKTNAQHDLAYSSIDVISIRVVRVGPGYTYPAEVYGKVIARDEIDYKCVYLFNCEREDAQTINSEVLLP